MLEIIITLLLSIAFCELAGYFIHILLHSQKIEFLSKAHMIHHLKAYAPHMPQRPGTDYVRSTEDRTSLAGIGMEWLLPIGTILVSIYALAYLFSISLMLTTVFAVGALSWGYFLFGFMHDSLHIKNHWLSQNRLTKKWYLSIRRLHDIHHLHVNDEGKMNVNYGICFFFFDRLFGSLKQKFSRVNHDGVKVAMVKYDFIND